MIVYRVYNEDGGYAEYTEEPQGVEFEIIDKTPTPEEIAEANKAKVPEKVKKAAFKLALIKAGISTSNVSDFIYSMPASLSKDKIIVLWEDTEEFYRNDPVLNDVAPLFNISQDQLDQIFILTLSV